MFPPIRAKMGELGSEGPTGGVKGLRREGGISMWMRIAGKKVVEGDGEDEGREGGRRRRVELETREERASRTCWVDFYF